MRLAAEAAAVLVVVAAVFSLPPIPQDPVYHSYAGDERTLLGIPRGANVLSSLPVAAPGAAGLWRLWRLWRRRGSGSGRGSAAGSVPAPEAACWVAALVGMMMVGATSAYYHSDPTTATLVWDRVSIATSFPAVAAALLAQRRGGACGLAALPLLLAGGIGSVLYWRYSELAGQGDLRPYMLAQGGSGEADGVAGGCQPGGSF